MTSSSSRSYDLLWMSLALLVLLPIALLLAISPHDYWFYVRTGQDILQAGSIPHIDTLSYTYAGTPLLDQPWLAEVIFWVAYRSGGATLTFLLRVICIGIAYAVVWILMRELGTEPWLATLLTILLGLSSSMNWTVRPQMFAYPLFAVTLWVLWRWQNSRAKHLWLLPIITALWANFHGSFILAFVLIGSALVFGAGERKKLALWFALSLLTTLINPRGIFVWQIISNMLTSQSVQAYAAEWHPPVNAGWQMNMFFGWLLLFIPLVAFSARRLSSLEWVWFLGFGWLALSGLRYVIWFMFIMAILTGPLLSELWRSFRPGSPAGESHPTFNYILAGLILLLPLMLLPGIRESWWKDSPSPYHMPTTPFMAAEWLTAHPDLPGPLFADYTFSSYLTFAVPSRPVWIDNRFHVYPPEHWKKYQTISAGKPQWEDLLDQDQINMLLLSQASQPDLILAVEGSQDWCEQYRDDSAVIFSRCEPIP